MGSFSHTTRISPERLQKLQELQADSYARLDEGIESAMTYIQELESSPPPELDEGDLENIRASILIDVGTETKNIELIEEGVSLLRSLIEKFPDRLDLNYNLANGLSGIAHSQPEREGKWFTATSKFRREARSLLDRVATNCGNNDLKSRCLANKANLLAEAHRWFEAYEGYRDAVQTDRKNGVASSGAAKLLLRLVKHGIGPKNIYEGVARRYIELARKYQGEISRYSSVAREHIEALPNHDTLPTWVEDQDVLDSYAQFVAREGLALSPTIEGLGGLVKQWDSLCIDSVIQTIESRESVPTVFTALNMLKSDYLAARWVCYEGIHKTNAPESGTYIDTLDYGVYGIQQSLLIQGQKAAIDILDKVAVATVEYLNIKCARKRVYFHDLWWKPEKGVVDIREWRGEIKDEIGRNNVALVALSELAEDCLQGGVLARRRELRNAGTHRLMVLHDLSYCPLRVSECIEHENLSDFEKLALDSLRSARAAILYFVMMVSLREARSRSDADGPLGVLPLFLYSEIRSDGDELK